MGVKDDEYFKSRSKLNQDEFNGPALKIYSEREPEPGIKALTTPQEFMEHAEHTRGAGAAASSQRAIHNIEAAETNKKNLVEWIVQQARGHKANHAKILKRLKLLGVGSLAVGGVAAGAGLYDMYRKAHQRHVQEPVEKTGAVKPIKVTEVLDSLKYLHEQGVELRPFNPHGPSYASAVKRMMKRIDKMDDGGKGYLKWVSESNPELAKKLQKTAIDVGSVKKMFRALKSTGTKVFRDPKKYEKFNPAAIADGSFFNGDTNSIFIPRGETTPRSTLLHEGGHALHRAERLEQPMESRLRVRKSPSTSMVYERRANNKAINFLRANDAPLKTITQYKQDMVPNYQTYKNYAMHDAKQQALGTQNEALWDMEPEEISNPVDTKQVLKDFLRKHKSLMTRPAFDEPIGSLYG